MMASLAGVALPGNRKRGFITADMEGYTCSTSSRLIKDAILISWKVPLPSQNQKFTNNPPAGGPGSTIDARVTGGGMGAVREPRWAQLIETTVSRVFGCHRRFR